MSHAGGDVHHPALFLHQGDQGLTQSQRTQGVGLEARANALHVRIEHRTAAVPGCGIGKDAGVVDQYVQTPVPAADELGQLLHRPVIGHIQIVKADIQPLTLQDLGGGLAFRLLARGQDHPVIQLGQLTAGFKAEAPIGPGDDGDGLLGHG